MAETIKPYAGPAKIFFNAIGLQPEGENGEIVAKLLEDEAPIAAAMFGHVSQNLTDQLVDITTRPFDNWGSLRTLFPAYTGVSVGASAGVLVIGTRAHTAANLPVVIWRPTGELYTIVRGAIIQQPTLHLGVGKALFDNIRMVGVGDSITPVAMGSSGYLISGNAITESGGADPGGAMTMSDFVRGAWTGVWGTVAGFGGAAGSLQGVTAQPVQAEEEWTITTESHYNAIKVQGRTIDHWLASMRFMVSVKPFGPSHTDIIAALGAHTHGQRLPGTGGSDLVLSGPSSKTITLKNASLKGAGYRFGGTTLGTDEIGFVQEMTFTAGAPQPLLVFSA